MSEPQPIRVIRIVEITEYAPISTDSVEIPVLPRGYDPIVDSPLAGGFLQYVGEPAQKPKRRWVR